MLAPPLGLAAWVGVVLGVGVGMGGCLSDCVCDRVKVSAGCNRISLRDSGGQKVRGGPRALLRSGTGPSLCAWINEWDQACVSGSMRWAQSDGVNQMSTGERHLLEEELAGRRGGACC